MQRENWIIQINYNGRNVQIREHPQRKKTMNEWMERQMIIALKMQTDFLFAAQSTPSKRTPPVWLGSVWHR